MRDFWSTFPKNCLSSYFSWKGSNGHISPSETAVLKQVWAEPHEFQIAFGILTISLDRHLLLLLLIYTLHCTMWCGRTAQKLFNQILPNFFCCVVHSQGMRVWASDSCIVVTDVNRGGIENNCSKEINCCFQFEMCRMKERKRGKGVFCKDDFYQCIRSGPRGYLKLNNKNHN